MRPLRQAAAPLVLISLLASLLTLGIGSSAAAGPGTDEDGATVSSVAPTPAPERDPESEPTEEPTADPRPGLPGSATNAADDPAEGEAHARAPRATDRSPRNSASAGMSALAADVLVGTYEGTTAQDQEIGLRVADGGLDHWRVFWTWSCSFSFGAEANPHSDPLLIEDDGSFDLRVSWSPPNEQSLELSGTIRGDGTASGTVTVSLADGCTTGPIAWTAQIIDAAPVVTTHPAATTVVLGEDTSLTADASGYPVPAVQWEVDTGSGWGDVPGATDTTLHLSDVPLVADGNRYRAVFENTSGTATTDPATLTVTQAPAVNTHPVDTMVALGGDASFTAAGLGHPAPTVQWQVDTGSGWSDVPGATDTTLSLPGVPLEADGNRYRAVFGNTSGTVETDPATLTVTRPVISLDLLADTTEVDQGGSVTLTATGLDVNGDEIGDVTEEVTFSSDVATDEIHGGVVTFPTASPHTITATHPDGASATIVITVDPATAPDEGMDPAPSGTALPATGGPGPLLPLLGLGLLLTGAALLASTRTGTRTCRPLHT